MTFLSALPPLHNIGIIQCPRTKSLRSGSFSRSPFLYGVNAKSVSRNGKLISPGCFPCCRPCPTVGLPFTGKQLEPRRARCFVCQQSTLSVCVTRGLCCALRTSGEVHFEFRLEFFTKTLSGSLIAAIETPLQRSRGNLESSHWKYAVSWTAQYRSASGRAVGLNTRRDEPLGGWVPTDALEPKSTTRMASVRKTGSPFSRPTSALRPCAHADKYWNKVCSGLDPTEANFDSLNFRLFHFAREEAFVYSTLVSSGTWPAVVFVILFDESRDRAFRPSATWVAPCAWRLESGTFNNCVEQPGIQSSNWAVCATNRRISQKERFGTFGQSTSIFFFSSYRLNTHTCTLFRHAVTQSTGRSEICCGPERSFKIRVGCGIMEWANKKNHVCPGCALRVRCVNGSSCVLGLFGDGPRATLALDTSQRHGRALDSRILPCNHCAFCNGNCWWCGQLLALRQLKCYMWFATSRSSVLSSCFFERVMQHVLGR